MSDNKSKGGPPVNNRKHWTTEENETLKHLNSINKSFPEIAHILCRTTGAVQTQLRKLEKEKQQQYVAVHEELQRTMRELEQTRQELSDVREVAKKEYRHETKTELQRTKNELVQTVQELRVVRETTKKEYKKARDICQETLFLLNAATQRQHNHSQKLDMLTQEHEKVKRVYAGTLRAKSEAAKKYARTQCAQQKRIKQLEQQLEKSATQIQNPLKHKVTAAQQHRKKRWKAQRDEIENMQRQLEIRKQLRLIDDVLLQKQLQLLDDCSSSQRLS